MTLTSTKDVEKHFIKVLVHGPAGAGKTRLAATVSKPLIISVEAGLLSLREYDLPVFTVNGMADMAAAYQEAKDGDYDWIVLDSISELAEICLADKKKSSKDGRAAYGDMFDLMAEMIRNFRDLPRNIYFSAQQSKEKDEISGAMLYAPSAPGKQLTRALPYLFDLVCALHTYKNEEGVVERSLQTDRDAQYEAKDRSGALDFWEPADLGKIEAKILGVNDASSS